MDLFIFLVCTSWSFPSSRVTLDEAWPSQANGDSSLSFYKVEEGGKAEKGNARFRYTHLQGRLLVVGDVVAVPGCQAQDDVLQEAFQLQHEVLPEVQPQAQGHLPSTCEEARPTHERGTVGLQQRLTDWLACRKQPQLRH